MNKTDLMTVEQLQRFLDSNPKKMCDQMICYAILRKRKEENNMNKSAYTVTANFTFETDNPDELKRILNHHIEYLLDLDDNRDIVKSVSVSDIHCDENVADSKGMKEKGVILYE